MAREVFESTDLIRMIYSFGDPSHREFTNNLKWDLRSWPEVTIERYLERKLTIHHSSYTFTEYLDELSTEKIKRMARSFLHCYCCARHNRHKNYLVYGKTPRIEWRGDAVFENEPTECECKCRHLVRMCTKHLYYREVYEDP